MDELQELEKKRAQREELLRQKEVELMAHRADEEKQYAREISRIKAQAAKPDGNFKMVVNKSVVHLAGGGNKFAELAGAFDKVEQNIKEQLLALKKIIHDNC